MRWQLNWFCPSLVVEPSMQVRGPASRLEAAAFFFAQHIRNEAVRLAEGVDHFVRRLQAALIPVAAQRWSGGRFHVAAWWHEGAHARAFTACP